MSRPIATFTLQILAPEEQAAEEGSAFSLEQQERRVVSDLPAKLEEMEENLTDMLPEGFRAEIKEWSE